MRTVRAMHGHDWQQRATARLLDSAAVKRRTAELCAGQIAEAAAAIGDSLLAGGKVLLCGNGGSAADCQHIAAEFIGRLTPGRDRRAWPAISLTANTSNLTAVGNDYGFEEIFSRQVEALGNKGDVLLVISTSGRSANLLKAVEAGIEKEMLTIGLLGQGGGWLGELVNLAIIVPSDDVQRTQESHITIGHVICELVEEILPVKKGEHADVVVG